MMEKDVHNAFELVKETTLDLQQQIDELKEELKKHKQDNTSHNPDKVHF